MIKTAGIILIILSSVFAGARMIRSAKQQQTQLQDMIDAMHFIKHELLCRLTPLPDIFSMLRASSDRETASFFGICADLMGGTELCTAGYAFRTAFERMPALRLPSDAKRAVLALGTTLGRFDREGSEQTINAAIDHLSSALAQLQKGSADRIRSCAAVCLSAGFAIAVILA